MKNTFEELVLSHLKPDAVFQPFATYDPDGDCIEFLASEEGYRAEPIDALLTVYYGRASGEIVGALLQGVSRFLKEVLHHTPGFRIEIEEGRIPVEHFFTARLWSSEAPPQELLMQTYKKLREVAKRHPAEASLEKLPLAG